MSNPSKAKGTAAETAVVNYYRRRGWHAAERRALTGRHDQGDVTGIPLVVTEVKACKSLDLAGWLAELKAEIVNARATVGAVWHKKRGTTDPAEWYVTTTGAIWCDLLAAAGYRDQRHSDPTEGDAA